MRHPILTVQTSRTLSGGGSDRRDWFASHRRGDKDRTEWTLPSVGKGSRSGATWRAGNGELEAVKRVQLLVQRL